MSPVNVLPPPQFDLPSAVDEQSARQVAQQFEAIFLRELFKSVEKAPSFGGKPDAGAEVFGSMMVASLADVAAQGGGIGLAEVVLEALTRAEARPTPASSTEAPPIGQPNTNNLEELR